MHVTMNSCGHLYTKYRTVNTVSTLNTNQLSLTVTVSLRVSFSSCQLLMRKATHWSRTKKCVALRIVGHKKILISLPYCAKMRGSRTKKTLPICSAKKIPLKISVSALWPRSITKSDQLVLFIYLIAPKIYLNSSTTLCVIIERETEKQYENNT